MTKTNINKINVTLSDNTPYTVPYMRIDSGIKGPCVLITAAMHGNELQGAEALCRALPEIESKLEKGSCIAMPFANPEAIRRHQPHIDYEIQKKYGRDRQNNLNCSWPGKKNGTSAERLSYAIARSILPEATHLLDLHCWNHVMASAVLVKKGDKQGETLAENTGLRFGMRCDVFKKPPHTLSDFFFTSNRPSVTIELSGQYGFWKHEIASAEKAIFGYLSGLNMLKAPGPKEKPVWVDEHETIEITAPTDGIFIPDSHALSARLKKGTRIGCIRNIETFESTQVKTPVEGSLFWLAPMQKEEWENSRTFNHPFVSVGALTAKIVKT